MNHRTPEWEVAPDPTNYDPAVPGPYTPPAEPDPFPHKPRRHGALVALGALAGLGIFALWIGATTDPEAVEIPNSAIQPTSTRPIEKAPPKVLTEGDYVVGSQIAPGMYEARTDLAGAPYCVVAVFERAGGVRYLTSESSREDRVNYFVVKSTDDQVSVSADCPRFAKVA